MNLRGWCRGMKKVSVLEVSNIRNQSVDFFTGTKKYVATGDVDEKIIETFTEVTYDNRPSRANIEVKLGQVLFARMKGTNKVIQIDELNQDYIYSTGFCVLEPSELVTTDYLRIFLKSDRFQVQKDKHSKGATQKAINNEGISKIKIPLPPIETQKKIVEALDKSQALIDARKEQIRLMDELVKSQFVEMFGDMDTNPKNFTIVSLDEICSKITDGKHGGCEVENGTGYYFVGAREIYDGVIHYDTAPEIEYKDFEKDYKRCNIENGDFVIVNTGATIGKTAIANSSYTEKTLLQKSVALLKTKKELLHPRFLQYCYITNPKLYKVESASAQPNLLISKIKKTNIYLPPLYMQSEFVLFIDQIEKVKFELQKGLIELDISYKALVQRYFG